MKTQPEGKNVAYTETESAGTNEPVSTSLDRESSEYLASIADISARMRPSEELAVESLGCPNPDYYADDEEWEIHERAIASEQAVDQAGQGQSGTAIEPHTRPGQRAPALSGHVPSRRNG